MSCVTPALLKSIPYFLLPSQALPKNSVEQFWMSEILEWSVENIAEAIIESAMVCELIEKLREDAWLSRQGAIQIESSSGGGVEVRLYQSAFLKLESADLKKIAKVFAVLELVLLEHIESSRIENRQLIANFVVHRMESIFLRESALSHYRSFDFLDRILGLNYFGDEKVSRPPHATERLYEGAGEGVQSSYATLFSMLRHLPLSQGANFIDLGSGYGRVGLIIGLLRPDIKFCGYEYEAHRVQVANDCVKLMNLQSHVDFLTQDLSLLNFHIPDADVYYLYDPFCEQTYRHVLSQLVSISRRKSIAIVTKGNARLWLQEVASQESWKVIENVNGDNICFYLSGTP